MDQVSYRRHRFPPPIIQHAIWLYLRFTLSYRDVEELLAERGLEVWSNAITYVAPVIKHPKFEAEKEWRLVRQLQEEDLPTLRFQQKQSMLRRHLPLALHDQKAEDRLPIVGVRVGPARHKEISKIAVADLLRTKGYLKEVYENVSLSEVPFQAI